jgi:hypothetical protein
VSRQSTTRALTFSSPFSFSFFCHCDLRLCLSHLVYLRY